MHSVYVYCTLTYTVQLYSKAGLHQYTVTLGIHCSVLFFLLFCNSMVLHYAVRGTLWGKCPLPSPTSSPKLQSN